VASLYHAMINLTWQLFPVNGSCYDARVTGLITALVAIVVVILWGPRTLTGRKTHRLRQPVRFSSGSRTQ
jgi:hypothetical protein